MTLPFIAWAYLLGIVPIVNASPAGFLADWMPHSEMEKPANHVRGNTRLLGGPDHLVFARRIWLRLTTT